VVVVLRTRLRFFDSRAQSFHLHIPLPDMHQEKANHCNMAGDGSGHRLQHYLHFYRDLPMHPGLLFLDAIPGDGWKMY